MASGRLANTFLSTTANTVVYTVPAAKIAVATVSVCNLGDFQAPLFLSLTNETANTPGNSEYLEYGVLVEASGGVYERTGIVISTGMKLVASSPTANNLAITVYGFEQDA